MASNGEREPWLKRTADAVGYVRTSVLGSAVAILALCGVAIIVAVMVKLIFSPATEIDLIEAPQELQARGFTAQGGARLLEGAIINASARQALRRLGSVTAWLCRK